MAAKPGLLETAAGGTLFLDEVGELPLATQAKLLRVIETREVTRLGSVRPRRIDVRFIAATNRELEAEVGRGAFRQDLYFRFNGITLTIPPLRTRVDEIPHLAETVRPPDLPRSRAPAAGAAAADHAAARGVRLAGKHPRAQERHRARGAAQRRPDHRTRAPAAREAGAADGGEPPTPPPRADARRRCRRRRERDKIITRSSACAGNQSRAAELLGMPRRTFVNKLDLYKIPRPKKKQDDDDT